MSLKSFDAIVLGLGGVGSATAYRLAKQGIRVLGVDQFAPPHDRGSSHGETRIIRKAYFEHADYVPLLCRAYDLWRQVEQETKSQLYFPTGLIEIGPPDGVIIPGIKNSAKRFDLPIESLAMREAIKRFPSIRGDNSWEAIVEHDAGYLRVEACLDAHLNAAKRCGAVLHANEQVVNWQPDGRGISLQTTHATYHADRLVIAAGPWANHWLEEFGLNMTVLRKHVYWYQTDDTYHETNGFPCFFFETPQGYFYGFPKRDSLGLKVAKHSGGDQVEDVSNDQIEHSRNDQIAIESFLKSHLPGARLQMIKTQRCYYTMTPDEHFVVDTLPDHRQVTIVAGLSGHGFKFTSVLGELAASLALGIKPEHDINFLRLARFKKSARD